MSLNNNKQVGDKLFASEWNTVAGILNALTGSGYDLYSYIVYVASSVYYAINTSIRTIQFSDADAATVINAAVNATNAGHGVLLLDNIHLVNTVYSKSGVMIRLTGDVSVDADCDAFRFVNTTKASLIGNPTTITWTVGLDTGAGVAIDNGSLGTAGANIGNKILDLILVNSTGNGQAIFLGANTNSYCMLNKIENIETIGWDIGFVIDVEGGSGSTGGWANVNEFINLSFQGPALYGMLLMCDGQNIAGNYFEYCWTELGAQNGITHMVFGGTHVDGIGDNTFVACKGVDFGTVDSYFLLKLSGATGTSSHNVFIGCQGSGFMPTTDDFTNDIWLDYGNLETSLYLNSGLIEYRLSPNVQQTSVGTALHLLMRGTPTASIGTRIVLEANSVEAKQFLELSAYVNEYQLRRYTATTYTVLPVLFVSSTPSADTEVARIDTDDNFKFNTLVLPSAIPTNVVAGSCYFTIADHILHIYDGSTWRTVTLT